MRSTNYNSYKVTAWIKAFYFSALQGSFNNSRFTWFIFACKVLSLLLFLSFLVLCRLRQHSWKCHLWAWTRLMLDNMISWKPLCLSFSQGEESQAKKQETWSNKSTSETPDPFTYPNNMRFFYFEILQHTEHKHVERDAGNHANNETWRCLRRRNEHTQT